MQHCTLKGIQERSNRQSNSTLGADNDSIIFFSRAVRNMPNRNTKPALLLLAILLLSACGSDSGFNEDTDFIAKDGFVQFVNMMPDSPSVIMLHGLDRTSVGFPLAQSVGQVPVDKYDWRIAYLNSNDDEVTVAEGEDQSVLENGLSTFLWMGSMTQPNIQIVDAPFILPADRTEGLADIWFASNLTNHPMVDIYLTDLGVALAGATPTATVTSGSFTNRFSVDAGPNQQLRITVAGSNALLFDSGPLEILDRTEDLYALVDDFGPDGENHANVVRTVGAEGSTILDVSQSASVRIGNYSEQTPVTATLGTNVYPNIIKQTRSSSQTTDNSSAEFKVTDTNGTILEESAGPVPIRRGALQSIYTFENNTVNAASVTRSLIVADSFRLVRDRALIKFINGSNDAVDFYVLRSGQDLDEVAPLLNDIGFAGSPNNESIANSVEYVVRNSGNTETLTSASNTQQEGAGYTLIFDTQGVLHVLTD